MFTFRKRLFATWLIIAAANGSLHGEEVRLVVERPLPVAAARALTELREALVAHGDEPKEVPSAADQTIATIVIGLAGQSPAVDEALAAAKQEVAKMSEAAAIVAVPVIGHAKAGASAKTFVLAGHDDRGLTYALRDAARGIAVLPKEKPWHEGLTPAVEQPFLKVRNVSVHLFNADCEREWFFSEEFWRFYFQRLSLSRFNRCTLTFCDQTNYLCPPYAYLVEMPEYPDVKIADCTPEQRAQNLAMVRRIAELADEYAVDFDLGIWMQAPVAKWAAPVQVTGLPEGLKLAEYCALGLRRILEACPSIDGLQLRMNAEAGVPEDQQTAFYKPMFQTMATFQTTYRNGRPLRLDLRYKGLTDETINAALDEKLDVTVSTKFWSEHLGMPYHPTTVDSHYAKDRYSFGTLLKKPRRYKVTYQLWNVGSNRLTLWGDPWYCSQFAKSCTLSGGEGFEVFAPLTNKGYGNKPGAWPVIKNPEYRVGKWEQERYWMFYLCFGRMGYNPATNPETWKREFRHRFGEKAADRVEYCYQQASRVLPLITAVLLPSASEWSWWPEMDTGGDLREYSRIQTSDPGQFLAMRRWSTTPDWRWEPWDSAPGRFEEADTKVGSGRTDTFYFMSHLRTIGGYLPYFWNDAVEKAPSQNAEWRMTGVDMKLLAALAEFHSHKLELAARYAMYDESNAPYEADCKPIRAAWQKVIAATDGVYHDDLVFGVSPDNARNKFGHHHSGHWRDRLLEVESDDGKVILDPQRPSNLNRALDAISNATMFLGAQDANYRSSHEPPANIRATSPTVLTLTTSRFEPNPKQYPVIGPQSAAIRVRPLDQTQPWKEFPLTETARTDDAMTWSATLPADAVDPNYDLQYFFVLRHREAATEQWPVWTKEQPYFVVPVEAK